MSSWKRRWKEACKHVDDQSGNTFARTSDPLVVMWNTLRACAESAPEKYPLLKKALISKSVDKMDNASVYAEIVKCNVTPTEWDRAFGTYAVSEHSPIAITDHPTSKKRTTEGGGGGAAPKKQKAYQVPKKRHKLFQFLQDYHSDNFHIANSKLQRETREQIDNLKLKRKADWTEDDDNFVEGIQLQYLYFE